MMYRFDDDHTLNVIALMSDDDRVDADRPLKKTVALMSNDDHFGGGAMAMVTLQGSGSGPTKNAKQPRRDRSKHQNDRP